MFFEKGKQMASSLQGRNFIFAGKCGLIKTYVLSYSVKLIKKY